MFSPRNVKNFRCCRQVETTVTSCFLVVDHVSSQIARLSPVLNPRTSFRTAVLDQPELGSARNRWTWTGGTVTSRCGGRTPDEQLLAFGGAETTRLVCSPRVDLSAAGNLRLVLRNGEGAGRIKDPSDAPNPTAVQRACDLRSPSPPSRPVCFVRVCSFLDQVWIHSWCSLFALGASVSLQPVCGLCGVPGARIPEY